MSEIKDNPLLNYSGLPPLSQVKPEHVKSAVETAIERCKKQIIELSEKYKNEPTWDNVISPIEENEDRLSKVWSVVSHLNSVNNTKELRQAHDECLPVLSQFYSWFGQYKPYFEVLKKIQASDAFGRLSIPQQKAIKNAIRDFKFLGFRFGKGRKGVSIRVHRKSWKKFKDKLKALTSRSRCGSIVNAMKRIKVVARGWLNYYGIADMKSSIEALNGWLYRRIRMCI